LPENHNLLYFVSTDCEHEFVESPDDVPQSIADHFETAKDGVTGIKHANTQSGTVNLKHFFCALFRLSNLPRIIDCVSGTGLVLLLVVIKPEMKTISEAEFHWLTKFCSGFNQGGIRPNTRFQLNRPILDDICSRQANFVVVLVHSHLSS
jgi:hypothetical protein